MKSDFAVNKYLNTVASGQIFINIKFGTNIKHKFNYFKCFV